MIQAGERDRLIIFKRNAVTTDDWGQEIGSGPTEIARAYARVKFGTAQEKRMAAQEAASQTATFECVTNDKLRSVLPTDYIDFDGSSWDLTEVAPLSREDIRFTGIRSK